MVASHLRPPNALWRPLIGYVRSEENTTRFSKWDRQGSVEKMEAPGSPAMLHHPDESILFSREGIIQMGSVGVAMVPSPSDL